MAPLTWRNVDAPSFAGANDLWAQSSKNFNNAIGLLDSGIGGFQDAKTTAQSNALAQEVMKYQDPAAYEAALRAGTVGAGLDPRYLTPAALDFQNQHKASLLAEDKAALDITGAGLDNQGKGINNQTGQFNLDQGRQAAALAATQRAVLPEANRIRAQIQSMADSGDPVQMQAARKLSLENADLLSKAGLDPTTLLDKSNTVFDEARGRNKSIQGDSEYWKGVGQTKAADNKVTEIVSKTADPATAIKAIQADNTLDLGTKKKAIEKITQDAAILFKPIDPIQSAIDSLTRNEPDLTNGLDITKPATNAQTIAYTNKNATRNKPLSNNLSGAVNNAFSPVGAEFEVFSGGQDSTGPNRTGSHRHDDGNAGDGFFKRNGKTLSWDNEGDKPFITQILRNLKASGVTGIGTGEGYMKPNSFHIGYGDPALWGKDGLSKNAPSWLRDIWTNAPGPDGTQKTNSFVGSPDAKTLGEAPIIANKPQLQNTDGTISTEQTTTIKDNGNWINIPTVINGQKMADADAVELYKQNRNDAVGRFKTLKEAEDAAQKRSDDIGKQLDRAANGEQPIDAQTPAVVTQVPTLSDTKRADKFAADTATQSALDRTLGNSNIALDSKIANPPNSDSSVADIVDKLKTSTLKDVPKDAITAAINEITSRTGATPAAAAIVAADSLIAQPMKAKTFFPKTWDDLFAADRAPDQFNNIGDDFGGPVDGGKTAPRIDVNKAINKLSDYNKRNGKGEIDLSTGVARVNTLQNSKAISAQVNTLQTLLGAIDQQVITAEANAAVDPSINIEAIRLKAEQQKQIILNKIQKLQPNSTSYTGALTNQ